MRLKERDRGTEAKNSRRKRKRVSFREGRKKEKKLQNIGRSGERKLRKVIQHLIPSYQKGRKST